MRVTPICQGNILSPADTVMFCCLEHAVCCKIQSFSPRGNNNSLYTKTERITALAVRIENSMRGNVTCENNTHQAYHKSELKKKIWFFLTRDKKKSFVYTWLRAISEPSTLPFSLDRSYS